MTGKEYLCFGDNSISVPPRVDQRHARPHPGECHWRALVNFHLQAVGHKPHHAGRFHPWNLLQLRLLLRQRNEKNVAADVGAHHFHDLRLGHVLHARDFDVVARFHAEAPRALAIVIQRRRSQRQLRNIMPRPRPRPTANGLLFFSEANFGGRRRAFARAETAIPRPHPGRPGARHPSPRARLRALGGYNSSCKMVGPDFRAISSGQLSLWNR